LTLAGGESAAIFDLNPQNDDYQPVDKQHCGQAGGKDALILFLK